MDTGGNFLFSVSGLAFAGLIPFFYALKAPDWSLFKRFVRHTSLISYSMYLAHIFAFMLGMKLLHLLGIFELTYPKPWLAYPLFMALVYLLATATYYGIEKPMLALRDR